MSFKGKVSPCKKPTTEGYVDRQRLFEVFCEYRDIIRGEERLDQINIKSSHKSYKKYTLIRRRISHKKTKFLREFIDLINPIVQGYIRKKFGSSKRSIWLAMDREDFTTNITTHVITRSLKKLLDPENKNTISCGSLYNYIERGISFKIKNLKGTENKIRRDLNDSKVMLESWTKEDALDRSGISTDHVYSIRLKNIEFINFVKDKTKSAYNILSKYQRRVVDKIHEVNSIDFLLNRKSFSDYFPYSKTFYYCFLRKLHKLLYKK